MKREYQNIVNYKKESTVDIVLGISIFIFIMGIASLLVTIAFGKIDYSQIWYCKCIVAIAMILVFFVIWGLCLSYRRSKKETIAFAIDSNEQGIWINSGWRYRMIYVPFSFIKASYNNGIVTFKYEKAFYYTKNSQIRLCSFGKEQFRINSINKNQFDKFSSHFNRLVSKEKKIKFEKSNENMIFVKEATCFILLILGLSLTICCNKHNFNKDIASTVSAKYVKKEKLQFNHEYSTSKFDFIINKGYRARSSKGKQVVIFNISLTAKDDFVGFDSDDLYITTDKDIFNDGQNYADNPLSSSSILIDGKSTPVINQLNSYEGYGDPESTAGKKLTYNVVFELPSSAKTNYFIYNDFYLKRTPASKDDSTPSYVLKFNPQKLEVLK